jgi:hypothetical protein
MISLPTQFFMFYIRFSVRCQLDSIRSFSFRSRQLLMWPVH